MEAKRIPAKAKQWALAMNPGEGLYLSIGSEGTTFLRVTRDRTAMTVELDVAIDENPVFPGKHQLTFSLNAPGMTQALRLEWLEYSIRLYADGQLADEEWPIGRLPDGEWSIKTDFSSFSFGAPDDLSADREAQFTGPMQYFTWPGHNTGVGDCMPFSRDGMYCLYYLFDRRGHRSKGGLGAHQWAQISSADLKTWTLHPMAVPITEQWEGSICTGSLIEKDGLTYAFYAVRMSDGAPARMTWATSKDGVHFEKSGHYFALTAPYESVSARDPMVFFGEDGQYHMLVTTSLTDEGRYGGCLAHLVSPDLLDWTQLPPFIVPGYADQPECSDYFFWNGYYYLVFSNFAVARYRLSKSPFGPWEKPECDVLDSIENQVVKTAAFGSRRLMTGFLARYPRTYAGNAVTHELIQRQDGTLGVRFVEEILPSAGPTLPVSDCALESVEGRAERVLAEAIVDFRLRARIEARCPHGLCGLALSLGHDEYRIEFSPDEKLLRILRPEQYFSMGDARNQLTGIELAEALDIDLIVRGDILDMVLSNGRCMTMRLNTPLPGARLSAYAQNGALRLTDIDLRGIPS